MKRDEYHIGNLNIAYKRVFNVEGPFSVDMDQEAFELNCFFLIEHGINKSLDLVAKLPAYNKELELENARLRGLPDKRESRIEGELYLAKREIRTLKIQIIELASN